MMLSSRSESVMRKPPHPRTMRRLFLRPPSAAVLARRVVQVPDVAPYRFVVPPCEPVGVGFAVAIGPWLAGLLLHKRFDFGPVRDAGHDATGVGRVGARRLGVD